jgi:hypothetical protein
MLNRSCSFAGWVAMRKFFIFATSALLCSIVSIAAAADGEWVTCKDGLHVHDGGTCSTHGGVLIEAKKSTPIDASKSVASNKTTATKTKSHTTTASKNTQNKTTSKRVSGPSAKCKDGAMSYSSQRKDACGKHGGVAQWYGAW